MAINFDATSKGTSSASTTTTVSHTCTGTNLILVVGVEIVTVAATTITGITYNGVVMTSIYNYITPATSRVLAYFYLINPATGAHNIVVSYSATDPDAAVVAMSYTGTNQISFPDNKAKSDLGPALHSSITQAVTTVANNCWLVGFTWEEEDKVLTAGANTTQRNDQKNAVNGDHLAGSDSNAAETPAGSFSLTTNMAGSPTNYYSMMVASLAPVPPPSQGNFFMLMN